LMREMPVKAASRIVGEQDTRLWRVLLHYVEIARAREDFSQVSQVGVDETSHRRGHDYVSEDGEVLHSLFGRAPAHSLDSTLDELTDIVMANIDVGLIDELAGLSRVTARRPKPDCCSANTRTRS